MDLLHALHARSKHPGLFSKIFLGLHLIKIYQMLIKPLDLDNKWKFKHYLINVILKILIYASTIHF